MKTSKVWFITGASKGLGLSMVKQLLQKGEKVAATSRSIAELVKAVNVQSTNFLPLQMDLLNEQSVKDSIAQTISIFGRIDVLVNNAGYGQFGTIEELSDAEARKNFDVNVFGLLNVTRNAMPHFRSQQSGHVFNISSIGGFAADFAGWGIYCATKFAVTGLTEALAAEAKSFGIKVTNVYPGYFRTSFLDAGSISMPANTIEAYESARASQDFHHNLNGNQMGDPEKAVAVMIDMVNQEENVLHLFLGQDAYDVAKEKINAVEKDMEKWQELATNTAFESIAVN